MENKTEAVIVSINVTGDNAVLVVGRQLGRGVPSIINAFEGQEAIELYEKLTTVVKKEEK